MRRWFAFHQIWIWRKCVGVCVCWSMLVMDSQWHTIKWNVMFVYWAKIALSSFRNNEPIPVHVPFYWLCVLRTATFIQRTKKRYDDSVREDCASEFEWKWKLRLKPWWVNGASWYITRKYCETHNTQAAKHKEKRLSNVKWIRFYFGQF